MPKFDVKDPAERLELAYLYPDGGTEELENLVAVAKEVVPGVACRAAVVHAYDLPDVVSLLKGTAVRPVAVIDFPDGLGGFRAKEDQARFAWRWGVKEADVVVNLRHVAARDKWGIMQECNGVRKYIPEIKLIAQIPYLWTADRNAIFWLIDFLSDAGVFCLKDWTGKKNFSPAVNVDFSLATRLYYTAFLAAYLTRHSLPLNLKIAGEIDERNAPAFKVAGADFLGVSYSKAKAVRGALLQME